MEKQVSLFRVEITKTGHVHISQLTKRKLLRTFAKACERRNLPKLQTYFPMDRMEEALTSNETIAAALDITHPYVSGMLRDVARVTRQLVSAYENGHRGELKQESLS